MLHRRTQSAERRSKHRGNSGCGNSSLCTLRSAICADSRRGFTLTEILVVIVIIVIVLGMAMPVFKFITGSRSEEGATNQISAMLARARADAIGLQKPVGVAFFSDGQNSRSYMAEVELANCPTFSNKQSYNKGDYVKVANPSASPTVPPFYYYIYISNTPSTPLTPPPTNTSEQDAAGTWAWVGGQPVDLRAETDVEALPLGVAVQTITDYLTTNPGNARGSDSYLGTGVILFGADGALTVQPYGISQVGRLGNSASFTQRYPSAKLVFANWNPTTGNPSAHSPLGVKSQMGLVVFAREAFVGQGFSIDDPVYNFASGTVPYGPEAAEEQWLDNNAQPILINRFNGTPVRQD